LVLTMVKELVVNGVEEFEETIKNFTSNDNVFVLFTGSPEADGKSWCPDCVSAEPVIHSSKTFIPANATLIVCNVGDRPYWKDPRNPFKIRLGISCVPTIMHWTTRRKLEEQQCMNIELLKMLYEED